MNKNSLSNTGLSLSQAQSISNLCNQRAREIDILLSGTNNCSKSVNVDEGGKITTHLLVKPVMILDNVVDLLKEKAMLHACQGFLMENIKAKDSMLRFIRTTNVDLTDIPVPKRPVKIEKLNELLSNVDEKFGWEQLSVSEFNEYIEVTAFAAHIGQYIHAGGTLDKLRRELPTIEPIEWMNIVDGVKSPVTVTIHHTSSNLLKIHESLAGLHRKYEQRVNYFKAKIKNIVTTENARIAKHNADIESECRNLNSIANNEYQIAYSEYQNLIKEISSRFEEDRQKEIARVAGLRINVDARFQETIDIFLKQIETKQ